MKKQAKNNKHSQWKCLKTAHVCYFTSRVFFADDQSNDAPFARRKPSSQLFRLFRFGEHMHLPVLYHICSSSSSRLEHIIVICKFAVEFLAYNTPIYLHPFKVRPLRVNQCCPESADKARFAATRSLRLSGNQTQEKSEAKCARPVKQGNDVERMYRMPAMFYCASVMRVPSSLFSSIYLTIRSALQKKKIITQRGIDNKRQVLDTSSKGRYFSFRLSALPV